MARVDISLSQTGVELLKTLSAHAANGKGWRRRGVRGWAFSDELPASVLGIETLRQLAADGRILREDVRDPFRTLPWCLHRITQKGQNIFADATGLPHVTVDPPAEVLTEVETETLYVSIDTWLGLEFLSAQEPGRWFAPSEIKSIAKANFYTEDGNFLISRGLVRRERVDPAGPRLFQVTELGRGARALDRTAHPRRVQVHVPGLTAAAAAMPIGGSSLHARPTGPVSGG